MSLIPAPPKKYQNALRLFCCASGICCSYWFYGFLQENLLTHSKLGATFILVCQTILNVFVALVWRHVEETGMTTSSSSSTNNNKGQYPTKHRNLSDLNHPLLGLVASTYVFAMVATNESLQFVSYPTAVLAKSCKMIPTMVMGTLVERRQYSRQQWIAALCISFGIAAFNLSRIKSNNTNNNDDDEDTQKNKNSDDYWKGMGLLFISLCMDGFLGSFQGMLKHKDETGKTRPPTAVETMLFVNLYAIVFLIPMAMASGQCDEGIQLLRHDKQLSSIVLLLNGVVSIGQIFIFLTIHWYSSLVCTTITTTRKFFTILISVLHFGHKFSTMQWISVCMVFSGLYLSIGATNQPQNHHNSQQQQDKTVKSDDKKNM